jgi:hypothetical protein
MYRPINPDRDQCDSQRKKEYNMQNDKAIQENPYVCKEVLDQVGKPDNYFMCKGMNVYDNRYRVNIYVREDIEDLTGHKLYIKDSYFCKLDGDNVTILS